MKTTYITRLLVLFTLVIFAQNTYASVPGNAKTFIYRVKIMTVTDKNMFAGITPDLDAIFDNPAKFNDTTDEIIVQSDRDLSKEQLAQQLAQKGHLMQSYRQACIPARDF